VAGTRIAAVAGADERAGIEAAIRAAEPGAEIVGAGELMPGVEAGALGSAVLTAAGWAGIDPAAVDEALGRQPAWSDFPFILVAHRDAAGDILPRLGNAQLVELPLAPDLLADAVRVALRQRERQHRAETHRREREAAEDRLRDLMATLESRVRDRMEDLRAANERLRESEELYRFTVELSQGIVWTADPAGVLGAINPRYYEMTGLAPGSAPRDAIHPDDRDRIVGEWMSAVASGKPHLAEYRIRMADGSYRHFRNQVQPRRDEEGRVVRWYGLINDIHEQKQAELALERAEERYRLAARATNNAIWDLDFVAETIEWTASESGFFGYPSETGTTSLSWWEERVHPEVRAASSSSLQAAYDSGRSHWAASYRFRRANGDYADVYDQGFMIRGEDGRIVRCVGAMADITELKRSEAEIRRVQTELIHVSRLSAMGAMASTLAHELNQPLTAVSSYIRGSRRLLAQLDDPAMARVSEALESAEAGALRAGHMVRRLRELVSRGRVTLGVEELPKLIQEAITIALVDAPLQGIAHRVELDPDALWVEVDPIQVQQVLINLIRNAVQAMGATERREIVISTRVISPAMAQVSVADTGCGLGPELQGALFSPFQSSKEGGMGIGLSISRTIVEAHGGKIWAEERPGGGAVFRFTLRRIISPDESGAEDDAG